MSAVKFRVSENDIITLFFVDLLWKKNVKKIQMQFKVIFPFKPQFIKIIKSFNPIMPIGGLMVQPTVPPIPLTIYTEETGSKLN